MKLTKEAIMILAAIILIPSVCFLTVFFKDENGDGISNNNETKSDPVGDNEAGYEFLYDPPAGGNPENVGKILFSSNDGKTGEADYDLYMMDPDGSNKIRLTDYGKFVNHPVWSPEHSRIAYSLNIDHRDKIFIMTADGKEKRQLTHGDSYDKFPTWSPDGKRIAYISYRNDVPNLFIVDIYGKNEKQLTFADGKSTVLWPSWSPVDNDMIAYSYNKAGDEIDFRLRIIRADGTGEKEILSSNDPDLSDHEPAWSPDGKTIYFLSNRTRHMEIWKLDYAKWESYASRNEKVDDKNIDLKRVSSLYSVNVHPDHRPRVSPDGRKIVFYGVGSDWNNIGTNLYALNVDGSGLANITRSIDGDEWPDW